MIVVADERWGITRSDQRVAAVNFRIVLKVGIPRYFGFAQLRGPRNSVRYCIFKRGAEGFEHLDPAIAFVFIFHQDPG